MKLTAGKIFLLTAVVLTGCKEDALEDIADSAGDIPSNAIMIDGSDGFYNIDGSGISISSIEVETGDFITPLDDGSIYFEQNDELANRNAKVNINYRDGSSRKLMFCQRPSSRSVEGKQFFCHHGIGYSYNAVEGKSCNLKDFRCQILNRAMLEKIGELEGYNFLIASNLNELKYTHEVYSSVTDYIQNTNVYAGVSGKIVMFSGDASATCSLFEEGIKSSYILKNEVWINRAEYSVDEYALQEYAREYPALLTSSFRHAVSNIKDQVDIDNFLYKYGTHVVVYSKLGARLTLEVQVDTHKFDFKESAETMAAASVATLFKYKSESSSQSHNYEILQNGTCRMSILGGDLSYLDKVIDLSNFKTDGTSEEMIGNWINSVKHNDNDLSSSNVEMIDMAVIPIWNLIPDEAVAAQVEARVTGNCSLIMETLGNKNFVNTSFDLSNHNVTCYIAGVKQSFTDPDVIDVIVANRHVATICHEFVPEIAGNSTDASDKLWVAYPIYEGRVQLNAGLTYYRGEAYDVCWNGHSFEVEKRDEKPSGSMVYMNFGALDTYKASNLEYQPAHFILGCERPGGLNTDGTVGGIMVPVYKHFGYFYLKNNATNYRNLPGWSYMTSIPQKMYDNYKSFFPLNRNESSKKASSYPFRMWRNADYTYIYNPTEVRYE